MKFKEKYKLDRVADQAKDASTWQRLITIRKNRAMSTDGVVAAVVPVERDAGDHDGSYLIDCVSHGRKGRMEGKGEEKYFFLHSTEDNMITSDDSQFPAKHDEFVPKLETKPATSANERSICLDVKNLLRICQAIGKDYVRITPIQVNKEKSATFLIEDDGDERVFGIIRGEAFHFLDGEEIEWGVEPDAE